MDQTKSEYSQLCIWPGCLVGEDKVSEFTEFMQKEFSIRVKYAEEVKTNPDPGKPGTGGKK